MEQNMRAKDLKNTRGELQVVKLLTEQICLASGPHISEISYPAHFIWKDNF